jgi:hypothetical protein
MTEQKQKEVLKHFKAGGSLTVLECLRLYHTTELRRIVSRLKKTGLNIIGKPVSGETFKQYFLIQ